MNPVACVKCKNKQGVILIESLGRHACNDCFKRIIFKRFTKSITNNKILGKKEDILVVIKNSNDYVLFYLLSLLALKHKGLSVYSAKSLVTGLRVLNQENLDDISVRVLSGFLKNEASLLVARHGPLESLSDDDLMTYSRLVGLRYEPPARAGYDGDVHSLIKNLEKTRKGITFSIKKMIEELT